MGEIKFITVLSIALIVLAFFGNGGSLLYYYLTMTGLSLLFLRYSKELNWAIVGRYKKLLYLLCIFLLGLTISTAFSQSIALSIEPLIRYLFFSAAFVFFLLLPQRVVRNEVLLLCIEIFIVVLLILSAVFFFIPGWGSLLPGMNLVYPSYGHNHLNALLLLVLPLALRRANEQRSLLTYGYVSLIVFGLILCFGRTAVFLAFLQMITMTYFYFRKNRNKTHKKTLVLQIVLTTTLIAFLLLQVLLPIVMSATSKEQCLQRVPKILSSYLCKNVFEEQRTFYWKQALEATRDYPIFGYGPGTFTLISTRYNQFPQLKTLYAHNEYLQALSEWGVVGGGLFIVLMLYAGYRTCDALIFGRVQKSETLKVALAIGVLALYVNAFFDFDWQFTATFLVLIIFLAIAQKSEISTVTKRLDLRQNLYRFIYTLVVCLLLLFAVLAVLFSHLLPIEKQLEMNMLIPIFEKTPTHYLAGETLTNAQRARVVAIYRNHPEVYRLSYLHLDEEQQAIHRMNMLQIDPWQYLTSTPSGPYTEQEIELAIQQAHSLISRVDGTRFEAEWMHEQIGRQLYLLAEGAISADQLSYALQLFSESLAIWELNLHQQRTSIPIHSASPEICNFLEGIAVYPDTAFGVNQNYYAMGYAQCMRNVPQYESNSVFLQKVHDLDGTLGHIVWNEYSNNKESIIKSMLESNKINEAKVAVHQWLTLWELTESEGWDVYYTTEQQLAATLRHVGDALEAYDPQLSEQYYSYAQEVN